MRRYRISSRQFAWLIASFFVTTLIINMPQYLARIASVDAWHTQIIPLVYGLILSYVMYRIAKLYPGKNFFEITRELAGKWVGGLLNILLLLHLWFVLAKNTALFVGFIKTNLLLRTPYEISLLLLVIVLIYYGKTSLEVAARINDIFFISLVLMIFALPLLLSNDISVYQLEPFFMEPPQDVGLAGLLSTAYYADIAIFAAFLPAITNGKTLRAAFRHGLSLTALLVTWVLATSICVLGPTILAREVYPTYSVVQQIHISDFLDRMEIFIFSVYFPSFIVSITLTFLAMLIGLNSTFSKSDNYQFYSSSAGWFLLMTLVFAFGGTPEITIFANFGYPAFVFSFQPISALIIVLLAWRKSRKKAASGGSPSQSPNNERGWKKWIHVTHLCIAFGFVCIIVGTWIAEELQWVARLCAAGYMLAMFGTVISTYMEKKRAIAIQTQANET